MVLLAVAAAQRSAFRRCRRRYPYPSLESTINNAAEKVALSSPLLAPLCLHHAPDDDSQRRHFCASHSRPFVNIGGGSVARLRGSNGSLNENGNGNLAYKSAWGSSPRRNMSDNLLGYSPMAQTVRTKSKPNKTNSGSESKDAADDGALVQTSPKRDKIVELKAELMHLKDEEGNVLTHLDEAATTEERLDLWFCDGLASVVGAVDDGGGSSGDVSVSGADGFVPFSEEIKLRATSDAERRVLEALLERGVEAANAADELKQRWLESDSLSAEQEAEAEAEVWTRERYEASLDEAIRILSRGLPLEPPPMKKIDASLLGRCDFNDPLFYVRDFVEYKEEVAVGGADTGEEGGKGEIEEGEATTDSEEEQRHERIASAAYASSIQIYRTLLLRSTAQTLRDNWERISLVSDGDIDRAAVKGIPAVPSVPSLCARDVRNVLDAVYSSGSCSDKVEAWWNLVDKDDDGLLDEVEMVSTVELTLQATHGAMKELVALSAAVRPAHVGAKEAADRAADAVSVTADMDNSSANKKLGWRDRRREKKVRTSFLKHFDLATQRHFPEQTELPHRLRCIYAWAEKSHQSNNVESVLVDASTDFGSGAASALMGRKRHVELQPKISHGEFVKVQKEFLPHLDKAAREVAESFREDLWVVQGKGRQNRELRKEGVMFLIAVAAFDYGIGIL